MGGSSIYVTSKRSETNYYRAIPGNPVDVYKQGIPGDEYMIDFHAWALLKAD